MLFMVATFKGGLEIDYYVVEERSYVLRLFQISRTVWWMGSAENLQAVHC